MNSDKSGYDSWEIKETTSHVNTFNINVQTKKKYEGYPSKIKENEQFIIKTDNKQDVATKEIHPEKPLSQNSSESTEVWNVTNVDEGTNVEKIVGSKIFGIRTIFVDNNNDNPEKIEEPVETTSYNTDADDTKTLLQIQKSIHMNNNLRNKLSTATPASNNTELNNINDANAKETSKTHIVKNEELQSINESDDKLCNSAENLIMNLDTREWLNISELNLDEFENIVYDLNLDHSPGIYDFEEDIQKYVIEKHEHIDQFVNMTPQEENSKENTYLTKSYELIDELKIEYTPNNEESKNDAIYVSSGEGTDLKLSWSSDDLDTMPLNYIKALCNDGVISFASETIPTKEEQSSWQNRTAIMQQAAKKVHHQKFKNKANLTKKYRNKAKENRTSKMKNAKRNMNKDRDVAETKNDIKTVSISSNDYDSSDSSCSGYRSTDFEFITEAEATSDGLIVNSKKPERNSDENTCRTIEVTTDPRANRYNNSFTSSEEFVEMAGPSRQTPQDNASMEILEAFEVDDSYIQNHEIPQGEQFIDLFQGIYAPITPCYYENKSMEPLMTMEYEGLGFDMRAMSREIKHEADDKYKEEANDIAKKILYMYPEENRKRRRRL